ncbi:hypothetical protein [Clostridium botulinum]|uniref:hypothetical protein n=1 Tax=Clostridium botulinum TaxID=1491 RepID=UPI00388FD828
MNILRRSLLNKKINRKINRWYKQLSEGEFNEFFIKVISRSKKILIIGKSGTGSRTLGESLLKINKNYKLYDFIKDIINTKIVFPINEDPYIVIIQDDSIENALSKVSSYQLEFDYAIHLTNGNKIEAIKAIKQS